MYTRIHPYALVIGMVLGIVVLFILRHPLFALFAAFVGVLIADLALKRGQGGGSDDKHLR